ncbi:MAG TPA: redoxin domain-containing protein [Luteibacter sp.]|uniref:redoxin domain-containing protein n=1 Tax=Luteibacter sp. TaxID=1886636 RepID=UPI002C8CB9F4|nr:redoxin domain-containing protein [Luteibacter sp.]HVI55929.1 redoxin domain-containing protein [Luteibacter sp.]
MKALRLLHLMAASALAIGASYAYAGAPAATSVPSAQVLPVEGTFPALSGATSWLNGPALNSADLRGKVVLVDFWTFSCINSLRPLPYLRAWAARYQAQGLVVIGVQSPEFAFEQRLDSIRDAVSRQAIRFPIAIDNGHRVWTAFQNEYWPAIYLIDAKGRIRYHRFGEGDYDLTERAIQQLLAEAGASDVDRSPVSVRGEGVEAAPDWDNVKSPETYLGYARTERFVSPGGPVQDTRHAYKAPASLDLNDWALVGEWTMGAEATTVRKANGQLLFRFHARDLHLVAGPATRGAPAHIRVRIDGKPPGSSHGADTDDQGNGTIDGHRLYQLIRQKAPIEDRTVEIEFLDPGVEVFAFTFG